MVIVHVQYCSRSVETEVPAQGFGGSIARPGTSLVFGFRGETET